MRYRNSKRKTSETMERRKAIKKMGFGFGGVVLTPSLLAILQGCEPVASWQPQFFKAEQADTLVQLVDLILPKTDTPSGSELNVPQFIDALIAETWEENDQKEIMAQFDAFLNKAQKDNGKSSIRKLSPDDLDGQLAKYLKSGGTDWSGEDELASIFADRLRGLSINAYKNTEYIGEQVLFYDPIPGQDIGCMDLMEATGGRAISP